MKGLTCHSLRCRRPSGGRTPGEDSACRQAGPDRPAWCRRASRPARGRQDGAAIITALLVVTLAAMLVTALFYRENVAIRSVENRAAIAQVRWVERAVIDWARVVLAADLRVPATASVDSLVEIWAQPIPEVRLDETATGGMAITGSSRDAFLAGQVIDAQSRFNLTSLYSSTLSQDRMLANLETFKALLGFLSLPEGLAQTVAMRVAQSTPQLDADGQLIPAMRPPLMRLNDLLDIQGVSPETLQILAPHVVILPEPTVVNLNTASAEVLAAATRVDLGRGQRAVRQRESRPFESVSIGLGVIGGEKDALVTPLVDVKTSYFIVAGYIRYDRVESYSETLLHRESSTRGPSVKVIWQQRN